MLESKGAQLFFREIGGKFSESNIYLVCGLVKTSEPVSDGDLYSIGPFTTNILDLENFKNETTGMAIDQVMQEPIWRLQ